MLFLFAHMLTKRVSIIEAYTFKFEVYFLLSSLRPSLIVLSQYRRISGTEVIVPIMSLGEDMEKLSLGDGAHSKDPFLLANAQGRLPTLKDVKKSLKV